MNGQADLGPNALLIGQQGSRQALATPALVLDLDMFDANIATMADRSRATGLAVRPHAKTHKCVEIARRQIAAGARGVCAANLNEVAVMLRAGIDVLLTSPVAGGQKIARLADLAGGGAGLTIVVDDITNVHALDAALGARGKRLPVLVDLDLGSMYRTGVATVEQAIAVAQAVARARSLDYAGVQFYSGIVQHIPRRDHRRDIYQREIDRLDAALAALRGAGLEAATVSGGGTGTFELDATSGVFTESQAGSYVVMDVEYAAVDLGVSGQPFGPALFVQTSVISNNATGLATIDAGTKALATDGPPPRVMAGAPQEAIYQNFGDEFGVILSDEIATRMRASPPMEFEYGPRSHEMFHALFGGAKAGPSLLAVGDKLELIVPHCDPTVNLHNWYHCVRGDTLIDIWPIAARGSL